MNMKPQKPRVLIDKTKRMMRSAITGMIKPMPPSMRQVSVSVVPTNHRIIKVHPDKISARQRGMTQISAAEMHTPEIGTPETRPRIPHP
jgi:hypothetical protein